jgi:phenylacetate-CoA ligase
MEMIKGGIQKLLLRRHKLQKEYLDIVDISQKNALNRFIEQKRNELFLHAYEHNKYYHRIFKQIGLIQDGEVDPSRIPDIPILTKDIIRKKQHELISDDYHTRKWFYNSSGGSTGEPVRLMQDDVYLRWRNATNYYYYKNILGIEEPTAKKVLLWGSERDLFKGSVGFKAKIQNRLSNTIFLNSFRMTERDIERYINTINSFEPEIVRGYAGSLYALCQYAEKKKISLYTPKVVVSAAESLSDNMRETIQSSFGTKVYNFYGSREVSNLAGECKEGLMHPFMFWNYQEVLDNHDQPVKEGEEGRVIVTNLFNYSMPIIRYEIGDMAILGPGKCNCGLTLPTFREVTGRITDHFILNNGTTVPAEYFIHLLGVVCNKGEIEKFQVIQEDYDTIRILAVPKDEVSDHYRSNIDAKIRLVMGQGCKIKWDFVDDIPKTPSGKYLYTKSLVWK